MTVTNAGHQLLPTQPLTPSPDASQTEYRAWNPNHNGVKRAAIGKRTGFFGVVNLLAPRKLSQEPSSHHWHSNFTYVQLKYTFEDDATGQPIIVGRTYMSFYGAPPAWACARRACMSREVSPADGPRARVPAQISTLASRWCRARRRPSK